MEGDPQQNERVRTWAGSDDFIEIFRILAEMRPLFKLRHVSWYFFSNWLVLLMRHNWLASWLFFLNF